VADPRAQPPLVLCAKSPWQPQIRREHAWATLAARRGHPVAFIAAPSDLRTIRSRDDWCRHLVRPRSRSTGDSLVVVERTTPVPGHRGPVWGRIDSQLLRHAVRNATPDLASASVVCQWPWNWSAVAAIPARRRVFDMTDDWAALMPTRARGILHMYHRIAQQADQIIIVSPRLAELFPGRKPVLIRNGVAEWMLDAPSAEPQPKTLAYIGTLTERFDAPLVREVLTRLPDWRLELVGACMYAGFSDKPAPELRQLLDLGGRVRWHGPLPREEMVAALDQASVAIIPNRQAQSTGQDSMKLYDYAARGRPIVSTALPDRLSTARPPFVIEATSVDGYVAGILKAASEPSTNVARRRQWAAANTWQARWPAWSDAVFDSS
jgi:Glycosyl transferases group 1